MTDIRPLGRTTVLAMLDLAVTEAQDDFLAPNHVTLAQALYEPGAEVFGIYDSDTPVGLLAQIDLAAEGVELEPGEDPNGIYVWRFMIDAAHQGRGHGSAALTFACELATSRGRTSVALTVAPSNAPATAFYEAAGFAKTGRVIDGEIELTRAL